MGLEIECSLDHKADGAVPARVFPGSGEFGSKCKTHFCAAEPDLAEIGYIEARLVSGPGAGRGDKADARRDLGDDLCDGVHEAIDIGNLRPHDVTAEPEIGIKMALPEFGKQADVDGSCSAAFTGILAGAECDVGDGVDTVVPDVVFSGIRFIRILRRCNCSENQAAD